jgi:hypothetical protein
LREELTLRVFENRVWRKKFGPKRDEITGEWRKLHNEELSDLLSSPNIIGVIKWRMRWTGHVARMWFKRGAYSFGRRPDRKRPFGRSRHRLAVNIKMDLQEVGWGRMVWFGLSQDRDRRRALVHAAINFRVL